MPLDRLLGRVRQEIGGSRGARLEAVIAHHEHRRARPGGPEDRPQELVLADVEGRDGVTEAGVIGVGAEGHARRHAVLESVPHHVDPLEVDRRQVVVAAREVGGDRGVVPRGGQDRDGQRDRLLHRLPVRGLLVLLAGVQHLLPRTLELLGAHPEDRAHLLERDIGGRAERRADLLEVVRRIGDPGGDHAARRLRPQALVGDEVRDLDSVHLLGRVGGPPGDEGVRLPRVAQDVPERFDLPEAAGDRHAPAGRLVNRLEVGNAVDVRADPGHHRGPEQRRNHRIVGAERRPGAAGDQAREIRQAPLPEQRIERIPVRSVEAYHQDAEAGRLRNRRRLARRRLGGFG